MRVVEYMKQRTSANPDRPGNPSFVMTIAWKTPNRNVPVNSALQPCRTASNHTLHTVFHHSTYMQRTARVGFSS